MGPSQDSAARWRPWVSRVVVPIVLVVVVGEALMRMAEPRFDRYDEALNQGDIPVLKLRDASEVLDAGGTMYVGASDTGSAFIPAVVAAAEGIDAPGYNASVPGMPTDMYATWSRYVEEAGAEPDRIVVGVNPLQFQELTLDLSEVEADAGVTIDAGLDLVRSNIDRAPLYAGTSAGFGTHVALWRSRQWIQHPTDAWHALIGADSPLDGESVAGLDPEGAGDFLRDDGTNARWDEPMAPNQVSRGAIDGTAVGAAEDDAVRSWVDDLRALRATEDLEVRVVLLPFTPQLIGVAGDPEFLDVRAELIDRLDDTGIDVLDLTDVELAPDQFADPLHFSLSGAELLSERTGRWLAGGTDDAGPG